ncbi:Mov34/MPN/PAD-1 family protein [Caballeronia sp. TF1N1]|uniref:Mov34/MPN/PAD-1 family protein n=1 Tax=Caballeronia sp. TF1N1 TaxID=2878153 RepID=UPI001FD0AEF8|nr:Mov34/MPN/PAD-1 family protein [Caballeronia sp. TF1N1]
MAALAEMLGRPLLIRHERFDQHVEIATEALAHLRRYRQIRACAREAGGQLFGSVDGSVIQILEANGPRREDERTRTSFRSDPISAQREIDRCVQRGLVYLGEWHTHPEPRPTASRDDTDALSRLLAKSRLRVNVLFMLIQGTESGESGVAFYSGSSDGIERWTHASASE